MIILTAVLDWCCLCVSDFATNGNAIPQNSKKKKKIKNTGK